MSEHYYILQEQQRVTVCRPSRNDGKNGQPSISSRLCTNNDYNVLISIHGAYPKILIGKEEGKAGSVFRPLNTSHSSGAAAACLLCRRRQPWTDIATTCPTDISACTQDDDEAAVQRRRTSRVLWFRHCPNSLHCGHSLLPSSNI